MGFRESLNSLKLFEKKFFEGTCLPFNGEEVHGFKIVSKGAMTYIKDSAVGFILAIIIIPWM